jgi:hypothetical protein
MNPLAKAVFVLCVVFIVVMVAYILFRRQTNEPQEDTVPAEAERPTPQLLEGIRIHAARKVKEGFETEEQIVQYVAEYVEDEFKQKDMQPQIKRITAELIEEHRRTQANWAAPTDCDKLDNAFANLEQQGIVARQNFTCCQNCGHAEIGDEIAKVQKVREVKGYTFYHMQDTESACETGTLYLAYGSLSGKEKDSVEVGHAIVKALRGEGLTVNWDGSLSKRICIVKVDWKRRRK